jgi:hypothetical protein
MPLFLFIFDLFYNIHTFIQSQYIHPSPFAEASLHILIACVLLYFVWYSKYTSSLITVSYTKKPNSDLYPQTLKKAKLTYFVYITAGGEPQVFKLQLAH